MSKPQPIVSVSRGTRHEANARRFSRHIPHRHGEGDPAGAKQVETHVVGGIIGGLDGSLIGAGTAEALAQYRFDRCVISASGFDATWAPTDFDLQKIFLKRLAIKRSALAILAIDIGKFERRAPITVTPLHAFARLVTDGNPPDGLLRSAEDAEVTIEICDN